MSQRIEIVPGDDVVGQTVQDIFKALVMPGILDGFNMTVAKNVKQVAVSPGAGVFDSGVFIFEDQAVETVELPLGSGAKDFTILYRYYPSNTLGGNPAVLTYEEGLLNPDTFTGGLILGWIRHSGGPSLIQKDFIPGRRIKLQVPKEKRKNEFQTNFAPFSTKWVQTAGPALSVTEGWDNDAFAIVTQIANAQVTTQSVTFLYPLLVPSQGLGQLLIDCHVPNTANIKVSLLDTADPGVTPFEYQPTNGSWTFIATNTMVRQILSVPQSLTLKPGQMAFIKLHMTLQSGSFVKLKTLGFSSYTEPF